MQGRPELPNLYGMPTIDDASGANFDTTTKQRVYPVLDGSTGVFVTLGQSRIANNSVSSSTPYTPTNVGKVLVLNPYDGAFYVASDPVLGASATPGYGFAGWHGRLGDKLLAGTPKYSQVIFVPIARSGASVTEWKSGAAYAPRIIAVCRMLTAMSITPTAWLWQQGSTDNGSGMSQATYEANLRAVISYARGQTGRSSDKWMIARDTMNSGTTSSAIRAAQVAVAGDTNNYAGPDCDLATSPTYSDGTHFNDTGNDYVAGLWDTAIRGAF